MVESTVSASEEFHGKVSDANEKRLDSPAVTPESASAKLIKEGEKLMTQRSIESITTKSKLQILREKLSNFFVKKK